MMQTNVLSLADAPFLIVARYAALLIVARYAALWG